MLNKLIPQSIKNIYHFINASLAVFYYGFPARKLTVIGVTGTDGKTTTSTLIYHLLKASGQSVALISTVAAYIGCQEIPTGFHVTSPNPWALQKLIAKIATKQIKYLVLEVTSHGIDQFRILGTNISLGVLTNITHEHLDYHRTYENYLATKARLFNRTHVAVINQDDASYQQVVKLIKPQNQIITYSISKPVSILNPPIIQTIRERFHEDYNQSNALAAAVVATKLGVNENSIISSIKSFKGIIGRMDEIKNNRGIRIIVDFAHTPNALGKVLKSLRPSTEGKLIAVYGAAGERDFSKRPLMGKVGADLADEVILTTEDPRTEDVRTIIRQIKEGVTQNHGHIHGISDRQQAINFAINNLAQKGDTVVICGKGHEQSMNLDGHTETPWSDHQAVKSALTTLKVR